MPTINETYTPTDEDKTVNENQIRDAEKAMEDFFLLASKNRREAQAKLMAKYPAVSSVYEAHAWLLLERPQLQDGSQFSADVKEISLEFAYSVAFNGLSFRGYSTGPMQIGLDDRSYKLALDRGAVLYNGVLPEDTREAARRYSRYLASYARYDVGMAIMELRILDPDNPNSEIDIKVDPPELGEKVKQQYAASRGK